MPISNSSSASVDQDRTAFGCLYLHGFASSPSSSKARFFADKLTDLGAPVRVPDLNQPAFETLTLSSQLRVIDEELISHPKSTPLLLIGSSMGGLLATIKSQSLANLAAMILMAPGFGLLRRWPAMLSGGNIPEWRQKGTIEVFHYGYGRSVPFGYQFIDDARNYQTEDFRIHVPSLVFHAGTTLRSRSLRVNNLPRTIQNLSNCMSSTTIIS